MRPSHTLLYSAAVDLVDRHNETITHTLLLSIWWTGTLLYSAAVDLVDRHNETITHFALLCCCRFGRCRLVPVATLFPMSSRYTSNRE